MTLGSSNYLVDTTARLVELKQKLGDIAEAFAGAERVIYYDYPVHLNVGDLLINLGTEEFFRHYDIKIWKRYYVYDFPADVKGIDDDVVIACHGGGNLGDLWPLYQDNRESLFERYPRNRFVIMPQTCYFSSEDALARTAAKLRRHPNLYVFVRDFKSQEMLVAAGVKNVKTMPDMAHMLFGVLKYQDGTPESGVLHLSRTDREAVSATGTDGVKKEEAPTVDWQGIVSPSNAFLAKMIWKSMTLQGKLRIPGQKSRRWYWVRDRAIRDGIRAFSEYGAVETDRLHAMILALLLGKRVLVRDNHYGKVSTYYHTWLQDVDHVAAQFEQHQLDDVSIKYGAVSAD